MPAKSQSLAVFQCKPRAEVINDTNYICFLYMTLHRPTMPIESTEMVLNIDKEFSTKALYLKLNRKSLPKFHV